MQKWYILSVSGLVTLSEILLLEAGKNLQERTKCKIFPSFLPFFFLNFVRRLVRTLSNVYFGQKFEV